MSLLFPEGWVPLNWLNGVKLRKPSGCLKPTAGGGGDGRLAIWALLYLLVFLYLPEHFTKVHGVRGFGVQTTLF